MKVHPGMLMKRKKGTGARCQGPRVRAKLHGSPANVKCASVEKIVKNEGPSGDIDENKRWHDKI